MNNGLLVVVSAPSGCGKDTVISKVMDIMKDDAFLSVSMTTREIRAGEKAGVNYHYISAEEFNKNIEKGEMLEYARYGDSLYGTPLTPVRKNLDEGKTVFLIIEVNGGENVKKMFPESKKIFIIPPSLEELERRLRNRATDSDEAIKARLRIAETELQRAYEYDYIVENNILDDAVNDVMAIIRAEQLKIKNMQNKLREVINNA
ncbi:MAG: guanylate kinase [Clostridia bacterium]|nr:guanylate kinase [Clostridia bacterium]